MFSIRLKQLIDHYGTSITAFESVIGVSKGAIAKPIKNNRTIGVDVLEKIIAKYPVDVQWLVSGQGSILKDVDSDLNTSTHQTLENLITITKDEFIELQRKALRQEDRIRELEKEVVELRKDQ